MTEMDPNIATDQAGETAKRQSELEQAQIICVIGAAFFPPYPFFSYTADRKLLGGPGVGKGTQCARMVADLGVSHLSVGDSLRKVAEKVLAKQGIDILSCMGNGKLVPSETVQEVLEDDIVSNVKAGKTHILLDGFPRSMDQTKLFEASVSAES